LINSPNYVMMYLGNENEFMESANRHFSLQALISSWILNGFFTKRFFFCLVSTLCGQELNQEGVCTPFSVSCGLLLWQVGSLDDSWGLTGTSSHAPAWSLSCVLSVQLGSSVGASITSETARMRAAMASLIVCIQTSREGNYPGKPSDTSGSLLARLSLTSL
jgi:hypothetical protein